MPETVAWWIKATVDNVLCEVKDPGGRTVSTGRATEAGLSPMTWHDFRHTFAGVLLSTGEDISTVAALMGHSDVKTTAHYDRRPAEQRRKAAAKISVPYFG